MLPLLLLAVALGLAAAVLVVRRRRPFAPAATEQPRPRHIVLAEAIAARATISGDVEPPLAAASPSNAPETLDSLLAELESATVRIDGADALDGSSVAELEGLAARLEAAAESLAAR